MVIVSVAVLGDVAVGVTVVGANVHVAAAGSPEHERLTDCTNPAEALIESVYFTFWPAGTLADRGFAETEKSAPADETAVPVSATVWGLPEALSLTCN